MREAHGERLSTVVSNFPLFARLLATCPAWTTRAIKHEMSISTTHSREIVSLPTFRGSV